MRTSSGFTPLIVCDTFPPEPGGMAQTASRLSKYLDDDGYPPAVLVFKQDYITVHHNGCTATHSTEKVLTSFDRQAAFRTDAMRLLPSGVLPSFVVSLYMGRPAYMGHLLSLELDTPHYIICLGSDINVHFDRFAHKWRYEWLIETTRRIGIIAPDMREKFEKFPTAAKKIFLLPPGFDQDTFYPAPCVKRYDFLFAGRARHVKGLDRLIKALSEVTPPARVCCAIPENPVDASFAAQCRQLAEGSASHHSFTWLTNQTPQQMRELYNASRFTVVPSRSEGAPHVVLEAMGCDCPIIASDVGRNVDFLGGRETVFETQEQLHSLIGQALSGALSHASGLRERALSVAGSGSEADGYLRFLELLPDPHSAG